MTREVPSIKRGFRCVFFYSLRVHVVILKERNTTFPPTAYWEGDGESEFRILEFALFSGGNTILFLQRIVKRKKK